MICFDYDGEPVRLKRRTVKKIGNYFQRTWLQCGRRDGGGTLGPKLLRRHNRAAERWWPVCRAELVAEGKWPA